MYFRLRTGDDPKKTATTFGPFGWGCELDTNGDPSKYEFFANVNGIISGDGVQLLQNTTQKFDDPKDTAEVTLQTYSAMVDNVQTYADAGTPSPAHARVGTAGTTLGGNASDYFVDFAIDLNDIPGGFNPAVNAFRVICGSSNSANNLAADIVDGTQVDTLSAAASDLILCGPSGCKSTCSVDSDCSASQFCNTQTSSCTSKLANGTAIPTVSGHTPALTGTCSAPVGTAVCTSGVCDTNDDKCGFANGDGACTAQNAATVCRGGACSSSGACMPINGCLVDGDCSANQFCDTSIFSCTAKLGNGTAIPSISGHTPALSGTCDASVGTAVCTSGVCDTNDNKCGLADGDGTCNAQNGATVCRSGACSANGTCLAAGACAVDADCSSVQYCDTPTKTCVAKVANGVAVPTVAGHSPTLDGTCTLDAGTAACAAGVCDLGDNACGLSNGSGSCDASNEAVVCRSGVCDTNDGKCGYADGDGACTVGNQAAVCRSGACSVSGVCNFAGGCVVDGDCTANQFCDTGAHSCAAKLGNGTAIPSIAGHSPALDGTCSGPVAQAVCTAGVCDVADSKCGYADFDGTCTALNANVVCRSQNCSISGVCAPSGGCIVDGDCAANQFCDTGVYTCAAKLGNGTAIPTIAGHSPVLDGTCSGPAAQAVCTAGVCDAIDDQCGYADGDGSCDAQSAGAVCRSGACSVNGTCLALGACYVDGDCSANQYCDTPNKVCAAKLANGVALPTVAGHDPVLDGTCNVDSAKVACVSAVCDAADNQCGYLNGDGTCAVGDPDGVCRSGACDANDLKCGYADGDGSCTNADAATVCRSGVCSANGVCKPTGGCLVDGDCTMAQYCDTPSKTCVSKLANGEAVPTVAGHTPVLDGTCTLDAGPAACASGVCDTKDNTCGFAEGDGPCTQGNASQVCRSGACSMNGTCLPMASCFVDGDCKASEYCDTPNKACASKLANGKAVPTVAGHDPAVDGACTPDAAAVVCASGVCDASNNACGTVNGTACTKADTCQSGVCNADGKCGDSNGTACMKADTCQSGVCNADGKCGDPNDTACSSADTCRSGVCNADGKCGDPDGAVCTEASTCRSGACSGGVCGALGAPDGGLGDGDAGAGLEVGGGGLRCSTSTHEGAGETGFGVFALGLVLAASRRRRR